MDNKFRRASPIAFALALCFASLALAKAPTLPPGAISDRTIAVVYFNGDQLAPAKFSAALKSIGATGVTPNQLARYAACYNTLSGAGIDGFWMVFTAPSGSFGINVGYFHVKDGVDAVAATKAIKPFIEQNGSHPKWTLQGQYICVRQPDGGDLPAADAASAKRYADALGNLSQVAIAIAASPGEGIKKDYRKSLEADSEEFADLQRALLDCQWTCVTATTGDSPVAHLDMQTDSAAAAEKMVGRLAKDLAGMKSIMEQLEGGSAILEDFKPKADKSRVVAELDTPALKHYKPALEQFLGMMLGDHEQSQTRPAETRQIDSRPEAVH